MSLWTIDVLLILPMILMIGALYFWLYLKKREGRKFPFSDAVMRMPGQTLARQLDDTSFDLAMYFGLIPIMPMAGYAVYLQYIVLHERQLPPAAALLLVLVSAGVTAGILVQSIRLLRRRHRYRLGYAGEVAVGGALNELMLKHYHVFHDIQGDSGFNVDHLVVGPAGVFAVETKTKTKLKKGSKTNQAYKVRYDGNVLYFPDHPTRPHTEFVNQAERGAKWVSQWLTDAVGERVCATPVLVLPGWFITIRKPGHVIVLNHKQLYELSKLKRPPLDEKAITQIAYQIRQKCQYDNLVPKVLTEE